MDLTHIYNLPIQYSYSAHLTVFIHIVPTFNLDVYPDQCSKLRVHPATCVQDFDAGCTIYMLCTRPVHHFPKYLISDLVRVPMLTHVYFHGQPIIKSIFISIISDLVHVPMLTHVYFHGQPIINSMYISIIPDLDPVPILTCCRSAVHTEPSPGPGSRGASHHVSSTP